MPAALTVEVEGSRSVAPVQRGVVLRWLLAFCIVYLVAALTLQHLSGVYHSELAHYPDEPSHVMTALMIRDYLLSGFHSSPLQYVENYYVHYPKVAIGMWPPFFHTTAAFWMLIAGSTHTSMLLFQAVQCAALATGLMLFARRFFALPVAFGLGLFLIFLPVIQAATSLFMIDIFLTIMEFSAMVLLVRYFENNRAKDAIAFGVCTSLAMLTKGNANCLLLLPVLLLVFTRNFEVLKKWPLYAAGAIIVAVGLPWQFLSMRLYQGTIPIVDVGLGRVAAMAAGYGLILVRQVGLPILVMSVLGLAVETARLFSLRKEAFSASRIAFPMAGAVSFVLAVLIFHCVAPVPGPEDRYMDPEAPFMLLFAALGVRWLAGLIPLPRVSLAARSAAIAAVLLVAFAAATFAVPRRPSIGMANAARVLTTADDDVVVIACTDPDGEGALIESLAFGDRRPQHIVLRASKFLSENTWSVMESGPIYRPLFHSSAELETYMEEIGVDALVVDLSSVLWPQDRSILLKAVDANPSKWSLLAEIPAAPGQRNLLIYRRIGPRKINEAKRNIVVKMRFTLGRDLVLKQ